jgi:DNA-binding MarR family transcriptional regulator
MVSRQETSRAVAQLMPRILQGIQLDFFIKKGVTQTQFLVLMALHGYGGSTVGRLAESMQVRMPTASGIISRLAKAGYVKRAPSTHDRRQVVIALTTKGSGFIAAFQAVVRRRWEEVLRALEPHELAMFYEVITKLRVQLEARR